MLTFIIEIRPNVRLYGLVQALVADGFLKVILQIVLKCFLDQRVQFYKLKALVNAVVLYVNPRDC